MQLSRLRVPAGYVVGLAVLVLARPYPLSLLLGGLLALAGEALRVWASGHIDKTYRLATGGPYAYTRNPLYLGSLLLGLGVAAAAWNVWAAALVAVYFAVFYPAVVREEGAFLRAKFAGEYEEWAQDVPAFVPRLRPRGPRASRFTWRRVRSNREWRAALAVPLWALVLYAWARFAL